MEDSLQIIKSITSAQNCPPFLLVSAPDEIRKRRICDHILTKVAQGKNSALQSIDAKLLNAQQLTVLRDEILSQSLFAPFRLFVINRLEELPAALVESFIKMLNAELRGVCCLCLASSLPASGALLKFFRLKKVALQLEALEGVELEKWIQRELKAQGITEHEPSAIRQLAAVGDDNPDLISQIISHTALFVDGGRLTASAMKELFSQSLEASEFDFIDALMQRNEPRSQSLLSVILASGKSPFMLVGLLQRSFSTYISIAGLLKDGKNPAEIGQQLKLQPWLLKKHLAVVQRYPISQLKRCIESLLRADSKLKNRSLGTESIFSEFVYNVTH